MAAGQGSGYKDTWLWNLGFSAYWFATSYKWFVLLLIVLPGQVEHILELEAIAKNLDPQAIKEYVDSNRDGRWGMVFLIGALWATVGPALFGGLSDRLRTKWGHRQPFIAIGAALTAVALMFLAQAGSFWMLVVGFLLLQFSDDVGTGPYSAMVPEIVPEERRGRASSIMSMLQLLGQLFSGIIAIVLMLMLGSQEAVYPIYIGIAAVNIACAVVTLVTVRKVRPAERKVEKRPPFFAQWVKPFKSADFRWVWITRFINALGFYLVVEFLRYFMESAYSSFALFGYVLPGETHDDRAAKATIVLALVLALTGACGAGFSSKYADKWGRKPLIYASGVIVFCALIPFAFIRDFTTAFFFAGLFGLGYGLYLSADWALVSDVVPDKAAAGTDMGVWQMSISSVQIVAGGLGALIGILNTQNKDSGYMSGIILAGCLFLLSTVLVRQVKGSR